MDKGEELQSGHVIDDKEDYIVDRDRGVCDPFLSIGSVSVSKERLWYYHSQGNDILNVCKSFLYYFALEQTLHFPEFTEWCAINYFPSRRIIISQSTSRIICKVNAIVICENLSLLENYPNSRDSVNESTLAEFYKKCETETR